MVEQEPEQEQEQPLPLHPVQTPEHKGILKTDSSAHFGAAPSSPGAVRFAPTVTTIHYDTETSDMESEMDWEDVYEGPLFDDL